MSQTLADIAQRRAELQRQHGFARNLKAQQEAERQAPQLEMEQLEAEMAQLEQQERAVRVEAGIQEAARIRQERAAVVEALFTTLNTLAAALTEPPQLAQITAIDERYEQTAGETLGLMLTEYSTPDYLSRMQSPDFVERENLRRMASMAEAQGANRINGGERLADLNALLTQWVHASTSRPQHRQRAAIAYVIAGLQLF